MSSDFAVFLTRQGEALRKHFFLLVIVSVLVGLGVYVTVSRIGRSWQVHYSYLISLSEREAAPGFRFDGYYALQATDLFAETLAAWIMTPEVIVAAHEEARLPLLTDDSRQISQLVEATQSAPQLVEVTVKGGQRESTERLAQGLISVMKREVSQYHERGVPALTFSVVETKPWVGSRMVSARAAAIASALFTFLLAVNVVLLRETVRR